jgi:sporulation protein YlmC with PRC-barrel domain
MLVLMAGPTAAQQQGGAPSTPADSPPAAGQASPAGQPPAVQIDSAALVGSSVRSSDGRDLGKVSRLMIDPRDGRVRTVVITRGGTLGMGGETLSLPWSAVRVGQDDRNVVLTVDQQILDKAPSASPRTDDKPRDNGRR